MKKFIVQAAAARMPSSCWGIYGRVAVLEVDTTILEANGRSYPAMISTHARGVISIVETWERRRKGKTERCAFERAWIEAEDLADRLNRERAAQLIGEGC